MCKFLKPTAPLLILLALAASASSAPPKVDYFFPAGAQRGTTVEVTVGGDFERWPVQIWCDHQSVHVEPAKASGKLAITVAANAEPGICWIRLYDEQGASIARPFLVGMLPEVEEKEPNDDPKKPQVLGKPEVVVNGRLAKPGDVDTFAVTLKKGQTRVASLEAHQTLRSPMDGVLQILSSAGFVLEQNDDYHGFDPQIAFAVPKDGDYLVRIFAFPAAADASIQFAGKENFVYRLTLTTGPYVEYVYPLAVARSAPGSVELVGWNIPDDLRNFPVPSRNAKQITLFHPRIANPFFVRLEENPVALKTKTPQAITMPVTVSGRLDRAGEFDAYQFDGKKGQKLSFRVESRILGFPLDPVLRLTDAVGKTLAQAKATTIGTDPPLDYTATQDGPHRLEVRDLHGHGGMRYVYRMRAGPVAPDIELRLTDDRFTLTPGKALEVPVSINRVGGFTQEIVITVEGLPKDVIVKATGKGIALQGSTAFAGPIRIVATAKDGTTRFGTAPVGELARTTEQLWLTVLKK
jgi:hypothetical protein